MLESTVYCFGLLSRTSSWITLRCMQTQSMNGKALWFKCREKSACDSLELYCTNYGKISDFTYKFRRFDTCRFVSSLVKEKNWRMKWSKKFQLSIVLLHQWEIRLHVNRIWICRWNFDTNVRAHTHTRGDRVMSLPCFRYYERALRSSHTVYLFLYRPLIHTFSLSLNSSAEVVRNRFKRIIQAGAFHSAHQIHLKIYSFSTKTYHRIEHVFYFLCFFFE